MNCMTKNRKKNIRLRFADLPVKMLAIVIVIFTLVSMPMCYAEGVITEQKNETEKKIYSEEYSALINMNLLCDDFQQYNSYDNVSRADFSASLSKLAGITPTVHTADKIPFMDISVNTKHKDEICTLYDMGIVSGAGDGLFLPDEAISYMQAVKLCLDVLGYRDYTLAQYGAYPTGYIMMAKRLDLNKGLASDISDLPLTAENAAMLLYNTARTEVLEVDNYSADGNVTYKKDGRKELLGYAHNIYYREGVLQSNGIVSLDGKETANDKVIIDGVSYNCNIDLIKLIGSKIKFFYLDDSGVFTIKSAASFDKKDVITINSHDLAPEDSDYSITNIVYYENDKKKSLSVNRYATIIYNNQLMNNCTSIAPNSGCVTFADTDEDGRYDVVSIEEFSNLVVVSTSASGNFVSGKYGCSLKLDDYENVKIFKDGAEAGIDDISGLSVISFVKSPNNKNIYIYVNPKAKTGVLTALKNDDDEVLCFDNGEYKLSYDYKALRESKKYIVDEINVGSRYTYMLDMSGDIAEIQLESSDVMKYAYFIDIAKNSAPFSDNSAIVKLMLTDGTKVTAPTADRVIIDGNEDKNGYDLLNDSRLINNGEAIEQVVKVSFNNDGMIKEIDVADKCLSDYGYDENKFTLDKDEKLRFDVTSATFGYQYPYYENTPIFAKFTNVSGDGVYIVKPTYTLIQNRNINTKLYDLDSTLSPAACVLEIAATEFEDRIVLVDRVEETLDSDGEVYKKLKGLSFGFEYEVVEKEDGMLPNNIKRGDILHITTIDSRLVYAETVCELSKKPAPFRDKTFANLGSIYGEIYTVNTNGIVTLNPDNMIADYGRLLSTSFNGSGGVGENIQIYDAKNDKVYSGTKNDIAQICYPDANGNLPDTGSNVMVYIYRRFEYAKDIVVVYN